MSGHDLKFFTGNIESLTNSNTAYRKVLFTTCNQQLVLMSLSGGEEIGTETHSHTTQFIRIEKGTCTAVLNGESVQLKDNDAIVIPPGTEHNIINASSTQPLKLYTIYSPPEHANDLVQQTKPVKGKIEAVQLGGSMKPTFKLTYTRSG
ncbi:cupin [Yasminevirus sp. GU-2018]|uniref:Cupin n=1 Tax=Yasminevirus sp. GU-2018 TaxID=2420051 RepID=A0A5K0U9J7_9VIRU|nr:cupin [Yasminevirus sp. GU-2018]